MGTLETVAPVFLFMGGALIIGYLMPYLLGKWDDRNIRKIIEKNRQPKDAPPRRWKCKCGTILVDHYCTACNELNSVNIQAYCPDCLDHPKDPVAC